MLNINSNTACTNFSSHTARYLRPPTLPTPSYNVLHSSAQRVSQVVMLRPISLISSNWALNYLWEGCSTVCLSFLFWVELIFIWVKYLFLFGLVPSNLGLQEANNQLRYGSHNYPCALMALPS